MALCRDLVDHLAGLTDLIAEGRQSHDLAVDAFQHDDAHHAHRQEQQRDQQEPGEELPVDGRVDARDGVDQRSEEPWQGPEVFGRRRRELTIGGGRHLRSLPAGRLR